MSSLKKKTAIGALTTRGQQLGNTNGVCDIINLEGQINYAIPAKHHPFTFGTLVDD
jgi:hypothetical protein